MGKKSNALGIGLNSIISNHSTPLDESISKDENGNSIQIEKINLDLIDANPWGRGWGCCYSS